MPSFPANKHRVLYCGHQRRQRRAGLQRSQHCSHPAAVAIVNDIGLLQGGGPASSGSGHAYCSIVTHVANAVGIGVVAAVGLLGRRGPRAR
jgi:hypothetical protein